MMKSIIHILFLLFFTSVFSQKTLHEVLKYNNKEIIPYITVKEASEKKGLVFLDARELNEYNVSHIQNAIHVGFNRFNSKTIYDKLKDKNAIIVVYCSVGVRSEKIGAKLIKLGYKNVFNLYGGIFEWKNNGGKIVTDQNTETDKVHTFNKEWSIYLKKGTKIYED